MDGVGEAEQAGNGLILDQKAFAVGMEALVV